VKSAEAVSVIIPAFNEEAGVGKVIKRTRQVLTKAKIKHEILVVDDGSKDETALRAQKAGARIISMGENRGYGASIKAGMREALYPLIAITDGDGLLGKWANYLADRKIPDLNSGLRVFRKTAALRYEGLFPNGFSFTTTITLALECHGYIVKYRSITYAPRVGKSKIRPIQDTINFFSLVLRVVMYFKPLKIFIPMSGIIFVVALASLLNAYYHGAVLSSSTLFLLVAGVQVAALGLLADLLVKRGR
jgi:glycosyltransferase involved in cell wall biosynthesis